MTKTDSTFLSPTQQKEKKKHAKANSAWNCNVSSQRFTQGQELLKPVIKAFKHKEGVLSADLVESQSRTGDVII